MNINSHLKNINLFTILLKKTLGLVVLCYCTILQGQTTYNSEGFETVTSIQGEDGKIRDHYGIWIDGGSNAYIKNTERYEGSYSFAIAKGNDPEKPYYGSIYTKTLDFSGSTQGILQFKYLVTNSDGNLNPAGSFAIEISTDGGENFKTLKTLNMATETVIKGSQSAWLANCKSDCLRIRACTLKCASESNSLTAADTRKYWKSFRIDFSDDLNKMTILRIKSSLLNTDKVTKIFIDELDILYTGGAPDLSENTITVESEKLSGKVSETIIQNFNSENDWGIWQDGGRNVYLTNFFALDDSGAIGDDSSYNVGLRNFFSGKHNGTLGDIDLGFQKPNYSGIVTENLDLTESNGIGLEFSFVAYNMKFADPTAAELAAAGNTDLENIDGESVLGYVPGPDYVEISISTDSGYTYKLIKKLTYGLDFINLKRQQLTLYIPGNYLATDDESDPEAILNTAGLTTTTKIKIQCFSDTDEQQFYIDQIRLRKMGTATSPKKTPEELIWENYEQTYLYADPTYMDGDTYELIRLR